MSAALRLGVKWSSTLTSKRKSSHDCLQGQDLYFTEGKAVYKRASGHDENVRNVKSQVESQSEFIGTSSLRADNPSYM